MTRKLSPSILVATLALLLTSTGAFAAPKPPANLAPEVTEFDVVADSASPVSVLTFTAADSDGTVTGYLITETSTKPGANAPGWSATAPTQYAASSVGSVTLYAWAKDNADAVSTALKSDTVTIPDPVQQRLDVLEAQVAVLQDLLQHFSRNGNEVVITGANLNIVSGSGTTDGPVNGLGNLVLGYNEVRYATPERTGSHNLILGFDNDFRSYAGIVAGDQNAIIGPFTSVLGGRANSAGGDGSVIVGGTGNETYVPGAGYAQSSTILGGYGNRVRGYCATVSGGSGNSAYGHYSAVSGGLNRDTPFSGMHDWAAGGLWQDQ